MDASIAGLRREYSSRNLLESEVAAKPVTQFEKWWGEALKSEIVEPNAMTLATASADGTPSARIVLLKGFDEDGFLFYTNYHSFKGMQLEENPKACLVFFWKELERQVRITGLVEKLPDTQSDAYFLSRPEGSQAGAWASPQSQVIASREWLQQEFQRVSNDMKEHKAGRPPHWGGYRVKPVIMEFWQGGASRLHDRIQYTLEESGSWKIERLAP